jgi:hypothetical protein
MRVLACGLLSLSLMAMPALAQEIPDGALPAVKAAPKLPQALRKKVLKAAPPVVRSNTWWGRRSDLSQKLLAGGGVSALAGVALVAVGASMANNAIERRHFLQRQEALDDTQRFEFTDQSNSVSLGTSLNLAGWVLCGAGSLVVSAGGML